MKVPFLGLSSSGTKGKLMHLFAVSISAHRTFWHLDNSRIKKGTPKANELTCSGLPTYSPTWNPHKEPLKNNNFLYKDGITTHSWRCFFFFQHCYPIFGVVTSPSGVSGLQVGPTRRTHGFTPSGSSRRPRRCKAARSSKRGVQGNTSATSNQSSHLLIELASRTGGLPPN